MDAILDQAGRETDPERRKALYSRFQKIVAEELPVYWAHTLPYHTVASHRIGNPPSFIRGTCSSLDEVSLK